MSQYCFLIPIYNHDKTITATVERLLPYELPIIIVDDGSIDNSPRVIEKYIKKCDKIKLLFHNLQIKNTSSSIFKVISEL